MSSENEKAAKLYDNKPKPTRPGYFYDMSDHPLIPFETEEEQQKEKK